MSAVLVVNKAMEAHLIPSHNMKALDSYIAKTVQNYVEEDKPALTLTLPEKMRVESLDKPFLRKLPLPANTRWKR